MRLQRYLKEAIKKQEIKVGFTYYLVYKGAWSIREYVIRELDGNIITKQDEAIVWTPIDGEVRTMELFNRSQIMPKSGAMINPAWFKREYYFGDKREAIEFAKSMVEKHGTSFIKGSHKKGKKELPPIQPNKPTPKKNIEKEPIYIFTHYGKGKGIVGLWGAEDSSLYRHFEKQGGKRLIKYYKDDKILFVNAHGYDAVPGEALFNKIKNKFKNLLKDQDHFADIDEEELYMDIIGVMYAKSQGYDAIIFKTTEGMQTIDLRNHTMAELKKNYQKVKDEKIGYYF